MSVLLFFFHMGIRLLTLPYQRYNRGGMSRKGETETYSYSSDELQGNVAASTKFASSVRTQSSLAKWTFLSHTSMRGRATELLEVECRLQIKESWNRDSVKGVLMFGYLLRSEYIVHASLLGKRPLDSQALDKAGCQIPLRCDFIVTCSHRGHLRILGAVVIG